MAQSWHFQRMAWIRFILFTTILFSLALQTKTETPENEEFHSISHNLPHRRRLGSARSPRLGMMHNHNTHGHRPTMNFITQWGYISMIVFFVGYLCVFFCLRVFHVNDDRLTGEYILYGSDCVDICLCRESIYEIEDVIDEENGKSHYSQRDFSSENNNHHHHNQRNLKNQSSYEHARVSTETGATVTEMGSLERKQHQDGGVDTFHNPVSVSHDHPSPANGSNHGQSSNSPSPRHSSYQPNKSLSAHKKERTPKKRMIQPSQKQADKKKKKKNKRKRKRIRRMNTGERGLRRVMTGSDAFIEGMGTSTLIIQGHHHPKKAGMSPKNSNSKTNSHNSVDDFSDNEDDPDEDDEDDDEDGGGGHHADDPDESASVSIDRAFTEEEEDDEDDENNLGRKYARQVASATASPHNNYNETNSADQMPSRTGPGGAGGSTRRRVSGRKRLSKVFLGNQQRLV